MRMAPKRKQAFQGQGKGANVRPPAGRSETDIWRASEREDYKDGCEDEYEDEEEYEDEDNQTLNLLLILVAAVVAGVALGYAIISAPPKEPPLPYATLAGQSAYNSFASQQPVSIGSQIPTQQGQPYNQPSPAYHPLQSGQSKSEAQQTQAFQQRTPPTSSQEPVSTAHS
eukprot:CAMPEP_0118946604 /NCGR_PEP_ID=MMETSP1169-20130426/44503_1 /TAXON_ID=36882 /ORGANISM="Pyramimonas obovata, Strain CCMP722" /LENGTH=169 /DNA_ID=CAMNT_0006892615 /DNA_START=32 /DNA_END=538 /DNA_ORIENTATION=-